MFSSSCTFDWRLVGHPVTCNLGNCDYSWTFQPIMKDHPVGHKNTISQDRWSLVTGSVILKCGSFCQNCAVFQDTWSLMAVVSHERFHCIAHLDAHMPLGTTWPNLQECVHKKQAYSSIYLIYAFKNCKLPQIFTSISFDPRKNNLNPTPEIFCTT